MNYNPPPINDNVSSAVKKMDSAMYGIQKQHTSLPVGGRLSMFRAAWSKLADNQWIRNIVEKGLKIPFKPHNTPKVNATPKPIQEKNYIGSKRDSDNGSGNSSLKESHRRSKNKNSKVLQSTICNIKENRGAQTSPRPEETQLSRRREKLQDGVTTKNMPDHTKKGLHDVFGLRRCIYAYSDTSNMQKVSKLYLEWESIPIQSSSIWAVIKFTYVHQILKPVIERSANYGKNQEDMLGKHAYNSYKTFRTRIQNQSEKISDYSSTDNYTSGNDYKHKRYDAQGTSIQGKRLTQKSFKTNKDKADNSTKSGKLYRKGTGYVNSTATGTIDVETSPRIEKQFSR
ncbi:hypothetical protein BB561_004014 [Smittium simulii]|uniref:Uncharacterized protein n=1 Tax=Smittium simulii TaxID=133385 RepID=A0A2T9YII6_9FUNG|nr:hypothetical protein BB561_004014 [Smittium simulii]